MIQFFEDLIRCGAIVCLATVMSNAAPSLASAESSTPLSHITDAAGNTLERFEPIWIALQKVFGSHTPRKIVVHVTKGPFSRFDTRNSSVLIAVGVYEIKPLKIIAHEASHIAQHNLTRGHSVKNQFKFIDEGHASVFASRVAGTEVEDKRDVLATAAQQARRGNVSLKWVQDWKSYWGRSRDGSGKQSRYAYSVGASFIYYLESVHGHNSPLLLMAAIGRLGEIGAATVDALQIMPRELEAQRIAYLTSDDIKGVPTRIVILHPPNGSADVPIDLTELIVRFDDDMMRERCVRTRPCKEVCYRNAYWKTSRLLAIKLPKGLRPNSTYDLTLGVPGRCRLRNTDLIRLPITHWQFKTGAN